MLDFLLGLGAPDLAHVNLLVTSRYQPDIEDAFIDPISWIQTTMDPTSVQRDISSYVSMELQTNRYLKRLSLNSKNTIKKVMRHKADGM